MKKVIKKYMLNFFDIYFFFNFVALFDIFFSFFSFIFLNFFFAYLELFGFIFLREGIFLDFFQSYKGYY